MRFCVKWTSGVDMTKLSLSIAVAILNLSMVSLSLAQSTNIVDLGSAAGGDPHGYLLVETIKAVSGAIRSAVVILDYKTASFGRFGIDQNFREDPNQRHLSIRVTHYADCNARTTAAAGLTMYSDHMGVGDIVRSFPDEVPSSKLYFSLDLSRDAFTNVIFKTICNYDIR